MAQTGALEILFQHQPAFLKNLRTAAATGGPSAHDAGPGFSSLVANIPLSSRAKQGAATKPNSQQAEVDAEYRAMNPNGGVGYRRPRASEGVGMKGAALLGGRRVGGPRCA